ncbi:hypothetical protein U9M48_039621 [Paspalum notatum var. saurae]|uniref:Uncharacterized protein n=1 Tax=Paspalum notatum var. saurae TaxID=547442 RepID=A0AAQ3XDC0_PASNO
MTDCPVSLSPPTCGPYPGNGSQSLHSFIVRDVLDVNASREFIPGSPRRTPPSVLLHLRLQPDDSADEEPVVQEQPLIEEPEDEQEDRQPTTDPVVEETNPSEEGTDDFWTTA